MTYTDYATAAADAIAECTRTRRDRASMSGTLEYHAARSAAVNVCTEWVKRAAAAYARTDAGRKEYARALQALMCADGYRGATVDDLATLLECKERAYDACKAGTAHYGENLSVWADGIDLYAPVHETDLYAKHGALYCAALDYMARTYLTPAF